jgi:hypothetical protein
MAHKNNEEEVDLGSLFAILSRGISKVFYYLGNILTHLFRFLIATLLFFKKNYISLSIAFFIGATIGLILELKEETKFSSNLIVETNFESAYQLYTNIDFYNNLVEQKNTKLLAEIFQLNKEEALSLKEFTITPLKNTKNIITEYSKLLVSLDSSVIKKYTYLDFQQGFTKYDYKAHNIRVEATKNDIFSKLDTVIIKAIIKNKYFEVLKKSINKDLDRTDKLLQKNLVQTDSLHAIYRKVLIEEAKVAYQNTSINLRSNNSNKSTNPKELELFSVALKLNKKLKGLSQEKFKTSNVINVIAKFQPIGKKIEGVSENRIIQVSLLSLGIMIVYLMLIKLNRYLNEYTV